MDRENIIIGVYHSVNNKLSNPGKLNSEIVNLLSRLMNK